MTLSGAIIRPFMFSFVSSQLYSLELKVIFHKKMVSVMKVNYILERGLPIHFDQLPFRTGICAILLN